MRVSSARNSYSFLLYVILRSVLGVVGNTVSSGLVVGVRLAGSMLGCVVVYYCECHLRGWRIKFLEQGNTNGYRIHIQ